MTSTVGAVSSSRAGHLHFRPGDPPVLRTSFDVAAYVRDEQGEIAVDTAQIGPLPPEVRRDLGLLARLEGGALSEARALLASSTSREARITAFLAIWLVERHWSARALSQLVTASGTPRRRAERSGCLTDRLGARLRGVSVERLLPIVSPVWTTLVGEPVAAGQMTRLALQETALLSASESLLPRLTGESHRVLTEVSARRRRQLEFFAAEARARLRRSARERRIARAMLRGHRVLRTVGVPDPDEAACVADLFRRPADRARLITQLDAVLADVSPDLSSRDVLPAMPRRRHGL